MDTSRRDMLLASLLATLPAMVVSEAVASPINPAQTIIQPPADHHWVSNKNYPERSVDMCPLAGSLTEPGLYLTLVRWWPGYMSAPHTYVTDRFCVVVSGTWWCNSGDDFDPASCGTKLLIRDVRCHAASAGNLDMARAVHFDSVDTVKNEHQSFAHGLA
jgi:hypothetical protein